jgi:hypothetical protein
MDCARPRVAAPRHRKTCGRLRQRLVGRRRHAKSPRLGHVPAMRVAVPVGPATRERECAGGPQDGEIAGDFSPECYVASNESALGDRVHRRSASSNRAHGAPYPRSAHECRRGSLAAQNSRAARAGRNALRHRSVGPRSARAGKRALRGHVCGLLCTEWHHDYSHGRRAANDWSGHHADALRSRPRKTRDHLGSRGLSRHGRVGLGETAGHFAVCPVPNEIGELAKSPRRWRSTVRMRTL